MLRSHGCPWVGNPQQVVLFRFHASVTVRGFSRDERARCPEELVKTRGTVRDDAALMKLIGRMVTLRTREEEVTALITVLVLILVGARASPDPHCGYLREHPSKPFFPLLSSTAQAGPVPNILSELPPYYIPSYLNTLPRTYLTPCFT